MDAAAARGAPLSLAEAVQQVTNSGTRLGSLQRVVEQSRGGAAPMARFYADRPGQVRDAGTAAIDRIGPVPANPSEIAPAVQQAAESTIGDAYRARTDAVRPLYKAAATDTVPAERIDAVLADLDRQIADDKTGLLAGPLGDLRQRLSYKAPASEFATDPTADVAPSGAPRGIPPVEAYMDRITPVRPDMPRPQSLQDFVRQAGGVQDPRGDLKSMGLDLVRGLVAKPGQGLGPDAMRQIAAEAGYLGPDIDHAMANTTVNDLLDALGEHPLYSVRDGEAVHAWDAHDLARSEAEKIGRGGRPAGPAPRDVPLDGLEGGPGAQTTPKRLPITDIENLDRTRKFFRDQVDLPQLSPKAIDKETGAKIGDTLGVLDQAMTDASSSFRAGKERYQDITRTKVEPLENGMIGALSKSREFGAQAKIILGENPLPGSAAEVANAVEAVKAKAPAAARALVSQRIRQVFNEATQTNVGGPNQWGGAKFNAVISGNDQQARNLKAAVEALHGPGVWRDFQKTLEVFEAMGRRQAPGSGTEFNRQIATELQRGGLMGEAASTAASPSTWLSKAREIYEGWRYGRNTEALAAMLTQPDAAKRLAAIAKAPVGSAQSKGMAAMYLLGAAANQGRKGEAK